MKKLIRLAIWIIGLTAPIAASATPVTWSFYETAITSCNGSCVLPPQPFVLTTLILPGPTSAGTGTWDGVSPPVYTGDNFTLTVPVEHGLLLVSPAFTGNPVIGSCGESPLPSTICDFDISWSETAGDLTAVRINIDAVNDNIGGLAGRGAFGLTGGPLASDGTLGGCSNTQCTVAGFWQSDLAVVPEPMSAVLLMTGLLGTCWASRAGSRLSYAATGTVSGDGLASVGRILAAAKVLMRVKTAHAAI
jgi:hypothetical protein